MDYAESFRELEVYKLSRNASREIFEISSQFPKEETYSLTDPVRRSSRSAGAQISEAWTKRRYEKHFVSKLTDADGEQAETQHWIETASDCAYISPEIASQLLQKYAVIRRMLNSIMDKSNLFCNKK